MIASLLLGIFTFVELNCENLFDCQHDSLKNDTEWTDESLRHWTKRRYWKKVNSIGKEIISCGEDSTGWVLPDMIALTEVENDSVMHDLCHRSLLRHAHYEYFITESPDLRGIDVALMYQPEVFSPLHSYPLRVEPLKDMRPTRDILYVSGIVNNSDTLHIFVVHSPSRFGGERQTRPNRMVVAERLCISTDSIKSINPDAQIIIAGDFNDTHTYPALEYIYKKGFTNVSHQAQGSHGAEGTYKFRGEWESIDNIMVSGPLRGKCLECFINDKPYLIEEDTEYGGVKPRRTYHGYRYNPDGFSDHLPLVLKMLF